MLVADWNRTPTELLEDPWSELVGGVVVAPVGWTCSMGSHRTIDFAVAAGMLDGMVELVVDEVSPWTPHRGVVVRIKGLASQMRVLRMEAAKPAPPAHSGPTRPWSEFWEAAVEDTPVSPTELWIRPGAARQIRSWVGGMAAGLEQWWPSGSPARTWTSIGRTTAEVWLRFSGGGQPCPDDRWARAG